MIEKNDFEQSRPLEELLSVCKKSISSYGRDAHLVVINPVTLKEAVLSLQIIAPEHPDTLLFSAISNALNTDKKIDYKGMLMKVCDVQSPYAGTTPPIIESTYVPPKSPREIVIDTRAEKDATYNQKRAISHRQSVIRDSLAKSTKRKKP